jgi:hypothetical protein
MGEHTERQIADRPPIARKRPGKQTPEAGGCWKSSSMTSELTLNDLSDTSEIGG